MTREELLDRVEELLRQHKDGLRGSIHREPNKGELFRLFASAFNSGLIDAPERSDNLCADVLIDTLAGRAPELKEQGPWNDVYRLWSAWTYAWRQVKLCNSADVTKQKQDAAASEA